jgi:hypothetical protein
MPWERRTDRALEANLLDEVPDERVEHGREGCGAAASRARPSSERPVLELKRVRAVAGRLRRETGRWMASLALPEEARVQDGVMERGTGGGRRAQARLREANSGRCRTRRRRPGPRKYLLCVHMSVARSRRQVESALSPHLQRVAPPTPRFTASPDIKSCVCVLFIGGEAVEYTGK